MGWRRDRAAVARPAPHPGTVRGSAVLTIGPRSGDLIIRTYREGFAAKAGHDLTIAVRTWSADIDPPEGGVTATVDLSSLEIRDGTGGALPLTDRDRREIVTTARRILTNDATATFRAAKVAVGTVEGTATLHRIERPVRIEVTEVGPDRYKATATVRQSEFGVKPYTAFLGALKLRDAVEIEINIDVRGRS
jgi:hypothetical protein